jgi:hypothetical protein
MKSATLCRETTCNQAVAERPRYYARQIITPDDMTLEQEYFRSRLRLHNRMLHGWGAVCGLEVCFAPKKAQGKNGTQMKNGAENKELEAEPWMVVIKAGYALSPCGDEINLDCNRTFDLRTRSMTGITGETCVDAPDPWCSEVFEQRDANPLYVAIRYKEVPTRLVRVQPAGCGCDDTRCEYSRLRDGYEIGILTSCPESHTNPPTDFDFKDMPIQDCPQYPDEVWVVLAEVTLEDNGSGKINKIDNCACRRMVPPFAQLWLQCKEKELSPPPPVPGEVATVENRTVDVKPAPAPATPTPAPAPASPAASTAPVPKATPPARKRRRKEEDEEI